jgi:hypothetical protein
MNQVSVARLHVQEEARTVTVALRDTPTRQCTSTFPPARRASSIHSHIGGSSGSSESIPSSHTPLMSSTLIRPSRSSIQSEPGFAVASPAWNVPCPPSGGISAHSPTDTTCVIPSACSMYTFAAWFLQRRIQCQHRLTPSTQTERQPTSSLGKGMAGPGSGSSRRSAGR